MSTVACYYLDSLAIKAGFVTFRVIVDSDLLTQTRCDFFGPGIKRNSRRVRHFGNAIEPTGNTNGIDEFFSPNAADGLCTYMRKINRISSKHRLCDRNQKTFIFNANVIITQYTRQVKGLFTYLTASTKQHWYVKSFSKGTGSAKRLGEASSSIWDRPRVISYSVNEYWDRITLKKWRNGTWDKTHRPKNVRCSWNFEIGFFLHEIEHWHPGTSINHRRITFPARFATFRSRWLGRLTPQCSPKAVDDN